LFREPGRVRTGTLEETEWTWELRTEDFIIGLAGKGTVNEAQGISLNWDVPDKDGRSECSLTAN
jgi:hypothetical protein